MYQNRVRLKPYSGDEEGPFFFFSFFISAPLLLLLLHVFNFPPFRAHIWTTRLELPSCSACFHYNHSYMRLSSSPNAWID